MSDKRGDAPGKIVHAIVNAHDHGLLFRDQLDKARLVTRMTLVTKRTDVIIHAWSLVDTHAHISIEGGQKTLVSEWMQLVWAPYCRAFNKKYGRSGAAVNGRYFSKDILDDAYLLNSARYILRNPLEAGLVPSVAALENYAWTALPSLLGKRDPGPVDVARAMRVFGGDPQALRGWLRAPFDREEAQRLLESAPVVAFEPATARPERDVKGELKAFEFAVTSEFRVAPPALRSLRKDHAARVARATLVARALDAGICQADIAAEFGWSRSAVSRMAAESEI